MNQPNPGADIPSEPQKEGFRFFQLPALAGTRQWFSPVGVFAAAMILALGYALCTDRVWEDYYITWKSSKNLVDGHGLVYHQGEKVHTFTSPLGVLLPALCSVLTFNHSDAAALWLFRIFSSAALAGAVALLYATTLRLRYHPLAAGLLALLLMTDAKSVDFSINGMETGILLLFLAYTFWAALAAPRRQFLHLGLAWGGLMWSRPDGFIYIGALAAGILLFNNARITGRTRAEWLKTFLAAGAVCTAVYLPWFLGAWIYYGSPVPHTVVAKATSAGDRSLWGAFMVWLKLPLAPFKELSSVEGFFMPSAYFYGGWPEPLLRLARFLAGLAALLWLVPRVRWETRAVSFALGILATYLGYFPATVPMGWYLPGPAWMAMLALGGGLARLLDSQRAALRRCAAAAGFAWLGLNLWLLVAVARQAKVEQVLVDDGNRRVIGEWLRDNSSPGDRVFMECLGYLGYFSGLKTLDYPGMSSPEVVAASNKVGPYWNRIIRELKPEWLALRPSEAASLASADPGLMTADYREVRIFDVSPQVETANVQGQGLLAYDSIFIIFKRAAP